MAWRFESIVVAALVLGSALAGLTAHGEDTDTSPVPMSCTGAGCGALGMKQGGTADLMVIDATSPNAVKAIAQNVIVQCTIRLDGSRLEVPCGQVTIDIKDRETGKHQSLKFNGSIFKIPVHKEFGQFALHVQPLRCSIAKDIPALAGSVTNMTFRHCNIKNRSKK